MYSRDIEEEEDEIIDFDQPLSDTLTSSQSIGQALDSYDEKERELATIALANLSSSMDSAFYLQFITPEIINKLSTRIDDPFSQVSYNCLSAIERLVNLCYVHNQASLLETLFTGSNLAEKMKGQVDSLYVKIKAEILEQVEKNTSLSKRG